jgi:hypothetical protein
VALSEEKGARLMAKQGMIEHQARCLTCGAACGARNAQAWAARHADAHGHEVEVRIGFITKPTS